jgi:ribosomal protein S18 acetylase RimI-like enzyme
MPHAGHAPSDGDGTRPLTARDLDRVVAIDTAVTGHSRPVFMARRLEASLRWPGAHIYTGYEAGGQLLGFLLARIAEGEFGGRNASCSLDAIGVDPARQGRGIGRSMMAATEAVLRHKRVQQIVSQAEWRNHGMLRFFAAHGFSLAPVHVLDRPVAVGAAETWQSAADPAPESGIEIDYSRPPPSVGEGLARDVVTCRCVERSDLDALVRIERKLTGVDRSGYFNRALAEIFELQGLRVSMVAEQDDLLAGFVMARVDFGEFARLEPVAVLDTLGVDPGFTHRHIASALLSQLLVNLRSLHVDRIRTQVRCDRLDLLGFFHATGFRPGQELAFTKVL